MSVIYDEARALKLLSKGSQQGFKMIYDHYGVSVFRAALRLLRSRELAEDLLQEVFTKIWLEHERFASIENFKGYLFICVRNRALDRLKQIAREDAARKEYVSGKKFDANSTDDYMLDSELTKHYQQLVEELPAQIRRVFKMSKDEGLSHTAIAEQLNIDPTAVKNYIYNARQFMRQRLEKHIVVSVWFILSGSFLS